MGASLNTGGRPGGGRRNRAKRHSPMHEINVTPFVDVMLVLLIIFMVSAPLLTVGVPVDLPEAKGQQLTATKEPLVISVDKDGRIFIQESETKLEDLIPKLKAVVAQRSADEQIFFRGFRDADYGRVVKLIDHIRAGGFHKIGLVTAGEK